MTIAEILRERRQKLGEIHHQYKTLNDKIYGEKRKATAEEDASFKAMDDEMTALELEIGRIEKQEERESRLNARTADPVRPEPVRETQPTQRSDEEVQAGYERRFGPRLAETAMAILASRSKGYDGRAFHAAWRKGLFTDGNTPKPAALPLNDAEQRALSFGVAAEGGNIVPPEEFVLRLIKAADDQVPIISFATVFDTPQAAKLGAPTIKTDPGDADWTTELDIGTVDSSMDFGKRELGAHAVAKHILVSRKLLRASPLNAENIVRDRLSYKLGVTQEKGFATGDGAAKPLGLWAVGTAETGGITTGRDVEIGNGSGAVDPDKLITARYTLKEAYAPRARWLMHRLWLAKLRKLKGSDNNYLWQPGLSVGAPPIFLDFPYTLDEYAPSVTTHAAGVYGPLLGDFSFYWVNRALAMELQRLDELKAATNQVMFIIRAELDAMAVLEDAFVRCLAAT